MDNSIKSTDPNELLINNQDPSGLIDKFVI